MRGRALADAEVRGKKFYDWFRGDKSIGFDGQMQEFFRDWFRSGASIGFDELELPELGLGAEGYADSHYVNKSVEGREGEGKERGHLG